MSKELVARMSADALRRAVPNVKITGTLNMDENWWRIPLLKIAERSEWAWTPMLGKHTHMLSRGQVAWALAHAFLKPGAPWGHMRWSSLVGDHSSEVAQQRLRCLYDYFERVEQHLWIL